MADAAIATREPRWEEARELIQKSIALLQDIGGRPDLARTYVSYARILTGTGQREHAAARLAEASAMFREMGMTAWLEKVERDIRDLG